MKKHAIIPIFIPHRGCPNDCVFCNQRKITARTDDVTPEDASRIIETWLTTLRSKPAVNNADSDLSLHLKADLVLTGVFQVTGKAVSSKRLFTVEASQD